MTKRVIAITDRRDAHLRFVEPYLDAPFIILDPTELAAGKPLTYRMKEGHIVVVYGGQELQDIRGVWFRKPLPMDAVEIGVDKDYLEYTRTALQRHFNQLFACFEDAVWVSDYFAQMRANNKSYQVAVAQRLGMNVPDTILTSDKAAAKDFLDRHPVSVTKTLTVKHPTVRGKPKVFFTVLVNEDFRPKLENLHLGPVIFQEAIQQGTDVRVIVVGEKLFAATAYAKGLSKDTHVLDYRLGHYKGEVFLKPLADFPEDLARQCIEHTKALGLRFGAMDFVLDKNGVYWFLENNPNGQWAFVEEATGQPIGKAMAELLQGGR